MSLLTQNYWSQSDGGANPAVAVEADTTLFFPEFFLSQLILSGPNSGVTSLPA